MLTTKFIVLVLLAFVMADSPSLEVSPSNLFQKVGSKWGEITYRIRLSKPGGICTGWVYPNLSLPKEEWPYRSSCRVVDRLYVEERWGGPVSPFQYIGEYVAFVQLTDGTLLVKKFQVLE